MTTTTPTPKPARKPKLVKTTEVVAAAISEEENPLEGLLEPVVGYMIEGHYAWNEFCHEHAELQMTAYPNRKSRTITMYELEVSYRQYRCYYCNTLLWPHD